MKSKKVLSIAVSFLLLFCLAFTSNAADIKSGDSVIIGGMPFGVKFLAGNMTVSGFTDVDGENGNSSPAYDAGMRENDVIINLNGKDVKTAEEVTRTVEESNGQTLIFLCQRDGNEQTFKVTPVKSISSGTYRIGIWIKDSTAGIGTVTYIDPKTGEFGGLGHGICSSETGELLQIRRGIVNEVNISGVEKGEIGSPGELKGFFSSGKIGIVTSNTENGVFGMLSSPKNLVNTNKSVVIASKEETSSGKATVICTLSTEGKKEYDITIDCDAAEPDSKSFTVTITDPDLLNITGGIVQGMSGSPIIQNGKLIGAVTHVLVNDPTHGYGIYIEDMLKASAA